MTDPMSHEPLHRVLVSDELFQELGADRVDWGEPDEDGFYTPSVYARVAAPSDGLRAVRAAIVSQLEHGLRHIPGATRSEERHYNEGQGFGLRFALERIDAALATTGQREGLDVGEMRQRGEHGTKPPPPPPPDRA